MRRAASKRGPQMDSLLAVEIPEGWLEERFEEYEEKFTTLCPAWVNQDQSS